MNSGGYPAHSASGPASEGYPAQECAVGQPGHSEGYLADGFGLAAVDPSHHALTHKPTDTKCDSCMRGKMRNLRKYAGAFSRPVKVFGDIVTMDRCSLYTMTLKYALSNNVVALVVRDVATFGFVYPSPAKDTEETVSSLQRFIGDDHVKRIYSDNADELINAARFLGIPHEASQQGMPQTNGIIEREVQDMVSGTRTVLVAAGMPGYFWSYAAPCYMHLDNCLPHSDGRPSAWFQRFGEEFPGQLIPFGAAVVFKPSPTKGRVDKPLPTGQHGVFLGYRCAPGGTWSGEYLVENLEYFAGLNLSCDAVGHSKTLVPHVTKQVRLPDGNVTFPLKEHYNKVNFALEGVKRGLCTQLRPRAGF